MAGYVPSSLLVPMMVGIDLLQLDLTIFSGKSGNRLLGPPMVSDLPPSGYFSDIIAFNFLLKIEKTVFEFQIR